MDVSKWVDSMLACRVGGQRLNLTAAQVSNPPLPALYCLHEGCLEGEPTVYMLTPCTLSRKRQM